MKPRRDTLKSGANVEFHRVASGSDPVEAEAEKDHWTSCKA